MKDWLKFPISPSLDIVKTKNVTGTSFSLMDTGPEVGYIFMCS